MVTTGQYCKRNGYTRSAVRKWLKKGLIPGAKKVANTRSTTGYWYLLPADAVPQRRKGGRPKKGCEPQREKYTPPRYQRDYAQPWQPPIPDVPAQRAKPMGKRETARLMKKYAGQMTYGQLSRMTGMPTMQLRELYDRLHQRYGI